MLDAALVAAAELAVVGSVACVSPDESSTISAITVDSSRTTRFGRVFRECGSALRRREVSRVCAEIVSTTKVAEICVLGLVVPDVTVNTVDCVLDGTTGAADGN